MSNDIIPDEPIDTRSAGMTKNQHVADAIRTYCEFRYPQRHAIMVNGKWGSGKTHLIEAVKEELIDRRGIGDSNKPLYITLYGVKDAAEIGEQIYQQMHPFLSHKGTRFVGALMKGILKTTVKIDLSELHRGDLTLGSQLPDVKISELLGTASQRVVIFDDFERAVMLPVELLGYINPFVEHDGCKVIILANEEAIDDADGKYKERKEKTIGQTLQVTADVEMAFSSFMAEIDTLKLRACYERHKSDIVAIFADSKLDNLRLLKQFLWDFERLWNFLTIDQRQHEHALLEIMRLLFAWTLEIRSNRVVNGSLSLDQLSVDMSFATKVPDERYRSFKEMTNRYPSVRFDSTLLSRDLIQGIIERSEFRRAEIQEQLSAHPYFAKPDELPAWRSLWHAHDQPAEAIPGIMLKFDADFESRRYRDELQIMHIASLCLWISDLGEPGWEKETVVSRIMSYIDDVYDDRPSTAEDVRPPPSLHRESSSSYGLGYRSVDDQRFKAISTYIQKKVGDWRRRGLPLLAGDLLSLMGRDSDAFLRQVCSTAVGPSTYARLPVLKSIAPGEFVAMFFRQNSRGQNDILLALSMRYEIPSSNTELSGERSWLRDVYSKLVCCADKLDPIPRAVLVEKIDLYLKKVISALGEGAADSPSA